MAILALFTEQRLRTLVHAAFRGLGLFSIRYDEDSAGAIFADHP
jgi:hypothetical protein